MVEPHSSGAYRRASRLTRAAAELAQAPCWRCGYPIDYDATVGPWRYTTGHVIELDRGGDLTDPDNLRPEHHRCNSRAGAIYGNRKRGQLRRLKTSRTWDT